MSSRAFRASRRTSCKLDASSEASEWEISLLMLSGRAVPVENNGTYQSYFASVEEILRDAFEVKK